MQELINWVDTKLKLDGYEHGIILSKATELLEKEREQIINAYDKGEFNQGCNGDAKQYYNETFKQK